MSSLAWPECRKEMLPQKDYDREICSRCGHDLYVPADRLRKIYCTECDDPAPEGRVHAFKY